MTHEKDIYDITIIGGGPVGMFAAFYAGMRQQKTKIIESLPILGGQPNILYPEKDIYDIAAYPKVKAADLTEQLIEQMQHFEQEVCLGEKVIDITKADDVFELQTTKGTHYSKTVIVTVGQGSFKPRRLPFDYPEAFEETNLDYVVKNLEKYRDKKVVICGGGDSAVDWALALESIASEVYLVHRRNKFRAHESSVEALNNSSINILTPYVPSDLNSKDGQRIDSITLTKPRSDETIDLELDHLIVNYGFVSSLDVIENWGIDTTTMGIKVNQKMETSQPGIFAAGDVAHYDGKIKLIAVGFGEAPMAVNHAVHYIDPSEHAQPIQSTKLDLD